MGSHIWHTNENIYLLRFHSPTTLPRRAQAPQQDPPSRSAPRGQNKQSRSFTLVLETVTKQQTRLLRVSAHVLGSPYHYPSSVGLHVAWARILGALLSSGSTGRTSWSLSPQSGGTLAGMPWAHGCALRHGTTSTRSNHDGAMAPEARAELRRASSSPKPPVTLAIRAVSSVFKPASTL